MWTGRFCKMTIMSCNNINLHFYRNIGNLPRADPSSLSYDLPVGIYGCQEITGGKHG